MKRFLIFFILALTLSLASSSWGEEKEEGSGGQMMDAETQAMMEKFAQYATPGENHKILDILVGRWDHVVKWWMTADSPPEKSTGTTETKWIMGGRYLQALVSGTSMGQPFEGMAITAYDNALGKYQLIWIDNMGTGMMIGEATYDAKKEIMMERGHFSDPLTGQVSYRGETKFTDDDHYTYEMFRTGQDGKEYRMLEISYTRIK